MTLPTLDVVALRVLVGPAAWTYHEALSAAQRVDAQAAFLVHGDVRLVAADILSAAAEAAAAAGAAAPTQVRRVKIEGIELERTTAPSPALTGQASTWAARAAQLRVPRRTPPVSVVCQVEIQ